MNCPCNGCGGYHNWKAENKAKFQAWLDAKNPPPKPEPVQIINESWDTPIALSVAEVAKLTDLKESLRMKGEKVSG